MSTPFQWLYSRSCPFHHIHSELGVILHILPGGRPSRSGLDPLLVSDRLWGFLTRLWNHQPALRPDMSRVVLSLESLQSGSDHPDGGEDKLGPSISFSTADNLNMEEVSFGHPCLSELNSGNLKGRLFKTDEYPFATGGNSNIYRGQLIHQNGFKIHVAIKVIRVSNEGSGQLEELLPRLKRETDVWSRLNHRNLLPFLGVWDEPIAPWPALISPFYKSGDLRQYLRDCPTADKEKMILGVASRLEYLHRHEIVHGDLKVYNVLVDKHGRACICDFGISRIVNFRGFTTSSVGTPPYMAPELFLVFGEIGNLNFEPRSTTMSSDVYSFALLILEVQFWLWIFTKLIEKQILTTDPLKHRPTQPILTAKAHGSLRPRRCDYDLDLVSSDFWDLLDSCWEPDPDLRPTIQGVILRMPLDTSEKGIFFAFYYYSSLLCSCRNVVSHNPRMPETFSESTCCWSTFQSMPQAASGTSRKIYDDESVETIIEGVSKCLLTVQAKVNVWARQKTTRIRSIIQQEKVIEAIESSHVLLSTCSTKFQLISHLNIHEENHFQLNVNKDHRDVLDYLAAIQNAQAIGQELGAAEASDVRQLMSMMHKFVGSISEPWPTA
ncbi:kinase-like domain-containing protein [Mycena capillaripes]|nr:kinase-like domain-containing protein [Mycena capillaripes]